MKQPINFIPKTLALPFLTVAFLGFSVNAVACPEGYTKAKNLDIVFKAGGEDFFVFDIGPAIVIPDGDKVIVPKGSHWVAQGTVYPGGTIQDLVHMNVGDAKPIGKWICQGGISYTSKVLEKPDTSATSINPNGNLGVGNFSLIFDDNNSAENPTQLFGNYTARIIDPTVRGTGQLARFELKAINSGTGANAGVSGLTIKSETYIDTSYNILLRYNIAKGHICVPNAKK